MRANFFLIFLATWVCAGNLFPAGGESKGEFPENLLQAIRFRNLGPFRAGSWITDFAVPEAPAKAHLRTFYVATRNGGLWKTENNGTTFIPLFDGQDALSIGAVAVASTNPETVWVGTGEAFCARSSSRGNGVYKSLDGGQTWQNMGLRDTHHIARILIHPQNPDIVYVAAMGHLFSPNAERGVFRSADGGKTWQKVLYVNERVGAVDLALNRQQPDILLAAMYEKERRPWHYLAGGAESAIYRTENSGQTWTRISKGLPTGKIGRIGLDIQRCHPALAYAIIENLNLRSPTPEESARDQKEGQPPRKRETGGEVYRSEDGGLSWKKMNSGQEGLGTKAAYSFNQIRIDPENDQKIYVTGVNLANSTDGGKTWHDIDWPPTRLFLKAFGDVRTLWIDPLDPERMLLGSDGGVHLTYDGGKTCDHLYNIPLGEFYAVGFDMAEPYNLYGGLQDHESWKCSSRGPTGEIGLEDWITVGEQDGMYNSSDARDNRWLYNTYQFGGLRRVDQKLGLSTDIQPRREKGKEQLRFNWTPPLIVSLHNSATIYAGAQVLLRSPDRGDHWQEISPNLTTNDRTKIEAGGGSITYGTITTIAESPLQPGLIWVGTDDGRVHFSSDGGAIWKEVTAALTSAGAPADRWVSRVFCSPHAAGTVYAAKTGFRQDDFLPYLLKTIDFGRTWHMINKGLPEGCVNGIIEDARRPDLLFAGTDQGLFLSVNAGESWQRFPGSALRVKISDLAIQPRENDLIAASYGRGLFVANIAPLQELDDLALAKPAYLLNIHSQPQYHYLGWGNYRLYGDRHLTTANEADGLVINYYLKEKAAAKVKITIRDGGGQMVRELEGPPEAGLHSVVWDMRRSAVAPAESGELLAPGNFQITLTVGESHLTRSAGITRRIGWSIPPFPYGQENNN